MSDIVVRNDYPVDGGIDSYVDASDYVIPTRILIQGGDAFSFRAVADQQGKFFDTLSGKTFETMDVVPLLYWRHSAYMVGKYPKAETRCFTSNFYMPNGQVPEPIAPACRVLDPKTKRLELICPKSKWTDDTEGAKHAPACAEKWSFVFFDVNNDEMFKLTLKGLNLYRKPLTPVRRWLAYVVASRKKLWFHQVTLGTVLSDSGKGYLVTFNDPGLVSEPEKYEALVRQVTYTPVQEEHDEHVEDTTFDYGENIGEKNEPSTDNTPY